MRTVWPNQTMHCGYFDITRKDNNSSFLTPTVVGGGRPFRLKFALKVDPPPSKNADFDRFLLITSQPQEITKNINYGEQKVDNGLSNEL